MSLMLARGPMLRRHGPPPAPSPFAAYYGIGPGQITFDLPLHDPSYMTLDGSNNITAVQHIGGAGAYFNATSFSKAPVMDATGAYFDGASFLELANAADMVDMHLIAAVKGDAVAPNKYRTMAGGKTADNPFFYCGVDAANNTLQPRVFTQSTNNLISQNAVPVADATAWHIMECRWTDGQIHLYLDGVKLSSSTPNFTAAGFEIPLIGGETNYAAFAAWDGYIGRCIGVLKGTDTPEAPGPAVIAARYWMADYYSVTLP